jgi:segregation and condensation protein A
MVVESFEEDAPRPGAASGEQLVLSLDGYEGPLDLLLALARDQKLDITRISILQLANQYLDFIEQAHELQLEIAADYLVMAAWLAYLKSRLLLPKTRNEEEPSGPELAAALRFQLERLEAMREAAARLMARAHLGRDFFRRGAPEVMRVVTETTYEASLYDLLAAYGRQRNRQTTNVLHIRASHDLFSVEAARLRLVAMLGGIPEWRLLESFLPPSLRPGLNRRSALAATLAASLELAKTGRAVIRQDRAFGPIFVKAGERIDADDEGEDEGDAKKDA